MKWLNVLNSAPNVIQDFVKEDGHPAYLMHFWNVAFGKPVAKKGDRHELNGLTVEVLESDAANLADKVSFRFDALLKSQDFHWLRWDWRTFSYKPFMLPGVGQCVTLSGPLPMAGIAGKKL